MRSFNYVLLIMASGYLSACSSTVDYQQQLAQTPSCCERLQDIHFHPATYNQRLTVKLGGKKAPVRQFSEGKSFFAAIKLPIYTSAYEIKITSLPDSKQLFWPIIQILDDNFQNIKELDSSTFVYSNGELRANFFINQDLGYRYLIIYTKPSSVGKLSEQRNIGANNLTIPVGTGSFNIAYGVDHKQKIRAAAGGKLEVEIIRYQPQTIK